MSPYIRSRPRWVSVHLVGIEGTHRSYTHRSCRIYAPINEHDCNHARRLRDRAAGSPAQPYRWRSGRTGGFVRGTWNCDGLIIIPGRPHPDSSITSRTDPLGVSRHPDHREKSRPLIRRGPMPRNPPGVRHLLQHGTADRFIAVSRGGRTVPSVWLPTARRS